MSHSPDESTDLSRDQRCRDIAAILARGIFRLHKIRQVPPESVISGPDTLALD
jgi:hypothetical protein